MFLRNHIVFVFIFCTSFFLIYHLIDLKPVSKSFSLIFLILPSAYLLVVTESLLKCFEKVHLTALIRTVLPFLLSIVLYLVILFIYNDKFNVDLVMKIIAFSFFVSSIIGILLITKNIPFKLNIKNIVKYTKTAYKISLPLMLTASIWILIRKIDMVMINYILGFESTGIYSIASQISVLPLFFTGPGLSYIGAKLSVYTLPSKLSDLQLLLNRYNFIMITFSVLLGFIICTIYPFLLAYLDEIYSSSLKPLFILIFFQVLTTLCGPAGLINATIGKPFINSISSFITLTINIILNFILIPFYGLVGASIATGLSLLLGYLIISIYVYRNLNISVFNFKI